MNVISRLSTITLHASLLLVVISGCGSASKAVAQAQTPSSDDQLQEKIVTGILTELNVEEKRGTIVTELGDPVFFSLPDPGMIADISQGQHVTAGINHDGVLTKIIETPVPELREPLK